MTTSPQPPGDPHGPPPGMTPRRWAAPQQFRPIADHELASQRSTRVATRALVWGIVAIVVSAVPLLNWLTLAPGIVAIQYGASARAQRLAGGSRAVWAIVLGAVAILGSGVWIVVHVLGFFGILAASVPRS